MAAPNIDVIAASLRSCSLSDAFEAAKLRPSSGTPASKGASGDAAADIVLDLNSDLALPCHWEQFLDLKTGRLHYINRSTGERTKEDPRKFPGSCGGYVDDSGEDEEDDDGDDADDEDEPEDDEYSSEGEATAAAQSDDSTSIDICSSTVSSSSSSASSREEDAVERGAPPPVLVAAGCRACMMYVMIPKGAEECPRCRGHVICFGRSGTR